MDEKEEEEATRRLESTNKAPVNTLNALSTHSTFKSLETQSSANSESDYVSEFCCRTQKRCTKGLGFYSKFGGIDGTE